MYPNLFFNLFPAFPRENYVFVAMSFDERFDGRWQNVIAPAIARLSVNGKKLEAKRVDARKVSDSILTEILDGIAKCRLFFADVTTIGKLADSPIRSANVMYEVGIAHAIRLPEEVVLFRSDDDVLLFDTSNIRVNKYQPDQLPNEAIAAMVSAMLDSSKELDLQRHLSVDRAADALTEVAWIMLNEARAIGGIAHPSLTTMGEAFSCLAQNSAIEQLLELSAIRAEYTKITPDFLEEHGDSFNGVVRYQVTEFGMAILKRVATRSGSNSPETVEYLKARAANKSQQPSPPK